jgi:hypothetical protein
VESMLAAMVIMHVELIQDSARDALGDQTGALKARTKSSIVALDRMLLGFLKELRIAQKRTVGGCNELSTLQAAALELETAPQVEVVNPDPSPAVVSGPPRQPLQQTEVVGPATLPAVPSPEQEWPAPRAHRRTEASVAAMMVVHSPPVTPCGAPITRRGARPRWRA